MADKKGLSGFLDQDSLTNIEDNHYMQPQAATAYALMVQAAKEAGVGWGVTDSYRSYDQQVDVANRKGLYNQGGWAAVPGTSLHGWGEALDLNNQKGSGLGYTSSQFKWLQDNANKYGFENIPREPWHWQFDKSVWGKYNQAAPWLGATENTAKNAQKAAKIEGMGTQTIPVKSSDPSVYRMTGYQGQNNYVGDPKGSSVVTADDTLTPNKSELKLGSSSSTPSAGNFSGSASIKAKVF